MAALCDGELFNLTISADRYRPVRIVDKRVDRRVALIVEPVDARTRPQTGVRMNRERTQLVIPGGADLPWAEWGLAFARVMPDELRALISNLQPDASNREEQRKRLRERLGTDFLKRIKQRTITGMATPLGDARGKMSDGFLVGPADRIETGGEQPGAVRPVVVDPDGDEIIESDEEPGERPPVTPPVRRPRRRSQQRSRIHGAGITPSLVNEEPELPTFISGGRGGLRL